MVLFDPGVSRKHARLFQKDGQVFVEDAGSSNGTRVNGEVIQGARALNNGDSITLGPVVFSFQLIDPLAEQVAGQETRIVNRQTVLPQDRKVSDAEMAAAVHQPTRGMSAKALKEELEKFRAEQAQAGANPNRGGDTAIKPQPVKNALARSDDDGLAPDPQDDTVPRRPRPLARPNSSAPALTAAERARLRRQAGDSLAGQIRYNLAQMDPKTRAITLGVVGILALGAIGGLYALFRPASENTGPVGPEPDRLSVQVVQDSFGLGPGVTWERPDMKVFDFEFATPTRAVVVLHYQSRDISEKEVAVILNGIEQGFVPADVAGAPDREIEQVLQVSALKRNQRNQIIFDNVKNPPGEEPWQISNIWIEVVPIPELSAEETIRSAQEYATRANMYVERREVASENLFLAWKSYRNAWIALESLDQKPELYETVRFQMNALKKELDQLCGRLMLDAERAIQLKNRTHARQTLEDVPRYFPTSEHRCHNLARQKMVEYDL